MAWRARWAEIWPEVRYCGEKCRRRRPNRLDRQLETAILELLAQRARGKTICPSEAARAVAPEDWRSLLEPTRNAARRLVSSGRIAILQRGRVVDPSTVRGPIRLRLARP